MAHECPRCGMICDCDGEDTWTELASEECTCDCEDGDSGEDAEFDDEEEE